jgi:Glycosyltransferase family 87
VTRSAQSFWTFGYREARAITGIVAVVLWVLAATFLFAGSTARSIAGPLKGGDFIFFYTLGAVAPAGDPALLYDIDRLHARQTALLPESAPEVYLPVYPPHLALLFVPFASLPYIIAAVIWTVVIIAVYAWVVRTTWQSCREALPDGAFVALAAAAFPPFWSLVLHAHNTIIPLTLFFLACRALQRDRRFVSGLLLGGLGLKPTFGVALAVVVTVTREWSMMAGILTSALLQFAAVFAAFDGDAVGQYVRFMLRVLTVEHLIEPKPFEMHSMRALTRLVPEPLDTVLWLIASAVVLERTVRVWTSGAPVAVRMGMLVLASVLVSPHLFMYDATVLALSILWIGQWIQTDQRARRALANWFWSVNFWLGFAFLLPVARLVYVQPSVLLMAWMLVRIAKHVDGNPSRPATRNGN